MNGFWGHLAKPVIGLSPMDGVSDAAFRYITDFYGHPSLLFTEFTSVEGICHGAYQLLDAFVYHQTSTPTVAQIFGAAPDDFYKVALLLAELGFDGIDINMGCPDEHVAKKGGGAALILKPELAQSIVKAVKQAVVDWQNGLKLNSSGLPEKVIEYAQTLRASLPPKTTPRHLPVSVKTRIGYDHPVTTDWISSLLEVQPAAISVHGRTLKQMYTGQADWSEIEKAARLIHTTDTLVLGNGDIHSHAEAVEKIATYNLDGALIGRAAFGNPWIFADATPTWHERLEVAIEHCRVFEKLLPHGHFLSLRKHLAWYCKGFDGAAELRVRLIRVNSTQEVISIISEVLG